MGRWTGGPGSGGGQAQPPTTFVQTPRSPSAAILPRIDDVHSESTMKRREFLLSNAQAWAVGAFG